MTRSILFAGLLLAGSAVAQSTGASSHPPPSVVESKHVAPAAPRPLPTRKGTRPRTIPTPPHTQIEQNPSREMYDALAKRMFALPFIVERPSGISVPGARAMVIEDSRPVGPPDAFIIGREFAHVHPPSDGSLHIAAPPDMVAEIIDHGWGELHPLVLRGMLPGNILMLYAPRDQAELEVVMSIVEASRLRALGQR